VPRRRDDCAGFCITRAWRPIRTHRVRRNRNTSRYRAVAHYVLCHLHFTTLPHGPSQISAAAVAITNRYADLLGWHGFVPVDFSSSTGRVRFSRKREWPTTFYCMPHLLFKVAALLWYNMQSSSPATTSRVVVTTARSCIEVEVKVQFGSDE
jgi:hypothetical protein